MKEKHHTVGTVPKFNRKKFVEKDKIDIPSTSNLVCTIRAGFTIVLKCASAQGHIFLQKKFYDGFLFILNLKAFCFGGIPDIMIELIFQWECATKQAVMTSFRAK